MAMISIEGSPQTGWEELAGIGNDGARIGRIGRWHLDFQTGAMQCDDNWHRVMECTGLSPIETVADFHRVIHPDDAQRVADMAERLHQLVSEGQDHSALFRILQPDGAVRWIRSFAALQNDADGSPHGAAGFIIDVTDDMAMQAAREEALAQLREANDMLEARQRHMMQWSFQDELTGLANRLCFDRDLDRACATAVRRREQLSIAIVEVDHFSARVAESGRDAGNAVLRAVAGAVARAARRPHDLAARYDGARFALLLPACIDARPILETLCATVKAMDIHHGAGQAQPQVTLSIGAVSSCAVDLAEQLLDQCALALFAARQTGGNAVVIVPDH